MNVLAYVQSVQQLITSIPIDDSSISVLAMLAGIVGGWTLTGLHQQLKAKRVRLARKAQSLPRKGP